MTQPCVLLYLTTFLTNPSPTISFQVALAHPDGQLELGPSAACLGRGPVDAHFESHHRECPGCMCSPGRGKSGLCLFAKVFLIATYLLSPNPSQSTLEKLTREYNGVMPHTDGAVQSILDTPEKTANELVEFSMTWLLLQPPSPHR